MERNCLFNCQIDRNCIALNELFSGNSKLFFLALSSITVCKNKMSKPFLRGQFFELILLQVWISDKRIQKRININEFIPSVWIRNSEIRETRLNAAPLVLSFSALSNQCLEETNKLSSLTSFYQVKANLWANEFWNRLVFSLIYIEVFRKTLSIQTNHVEKILIW